MSLRIAAAAEYEIKEAALWYDDQQSGLGDQFATACYDAIEQIEVQPDRFGRMETIRSRRDIRRCVLQKFPYIIVYEIIQDDIFVLAVSHASRRPNYWIRRNK